MSAVQASTEGRKPLTTAQLYSAAHPKINGALHHKGLDRDVTPCHCLAIGTVRCGVNQMASTYDLIKALPGKGTNWRGLVDALSASYVVEYAKRHDGAAPWPNNTTDEWARAKGVRELRYAAMYAATMIVDTKSRRSSFIPPSPETLSWGGFLGGETVVYTDDAAYADAVQECAAIISTCVAA